MKCSTWPVTRPARVLLLPVAILLAGLLLLSSPAKSQPERTLFERLGGVYPIALTVNDLVDRLYINKTLNANPRIKKVHESIGSRESAKVALTAWAIRRLPRIQTSLVRLSRSGQVVRVPKNP